MYRLYKNELLTFWSYDMHFIYLKMFLNAKNLTSIFLKNRIVAM